MKGVGLALAAAVVVGVGLGHALMPHETVVVRLPNPVTEVEPGKPYCMFDAEVPTHLTVAGPAGGSITVDGRARGVLVLVDEDVADEAQPFDGIRFNVKGPGVVAVDGNECEST